jgi:hypothetical protein
MQTIFPVIAVIAATFGCMVGYFMRGRLRPTILICTVTPIIVQVVILSLLPHEGYVKSEEVILIYYCILPFLLLTVPCLGSAVLTALFVYHTKRANGRADTRATAPEYPVSESGLVQPWRRR